MSTEIENKVGYVLGGFIAYPPESDNEMEGMEDNAYSATSTAFNYTDTKDEMMDAIRRCLPRDIWLISVWKTDYTGSSYQAKLGSTRRITQTVVNDYISRALSGTGNFRFN